MPQDFSEKSKVVAIFLEILLFWHSQKNMMKVCSQKNIINVFFFAQEFSVNVFFFITNSDSALSSSFHVNSLTESICNKFNSIKQLKHIKCQILHNACHDKV